MIEKITGLAVLDECHRLLTEKKRTDEAMLHLLRGLGEIRRESSPERWDHFTKTQCITHPIHQLLTQDPFTHRGFFKPRGYAGDAVLMDLIYRCGDSENLNQPASPLGREIGEFLTSGPGAASVRWRKQFLARQIDWTANMTSGARILSVACGHVREAELSEAVRKRQVRQFIAFDQDSQSLELIQNQYAHLGVTPSLGSVLGILRGRTRLGPFDLIYSAGLYDYLPEAVASRLTAKLFEWLRPGGRLLVANFLPNVFEKAYMEAIMQWNLIYRSPIEMEAIAAEIPSAEIEAIQNIADPMDAVIYLELTKRATDFRFASDSVQDAA